MTIKELKYILNQCKLPQHAEIKIRSHSAMKIDSLDVLDCNGEYGIITKNRKTSLVLFLDPVLQ